MADRLERMQRNFLWGSSEGSFKYSLVYDKVYLPIEMGGLGIWNVVSFNQVLLGIRNVVSFNQVLLGK